MTQTLEGFHAGELVAQARAGVLREAARLEGMLAPADLGGGAAAFLAGRQLLVIASTDASNRLWVSPVVGRPGFLLGAGATLAVDGHPASGDPLARLQVGAAIGSVAIDFATRRRMRVNGTVGAVGERGFEILVEQAYGNCPQFIQERDLFDAEDTVTAVGTTHDALGDDLVSMIRSADTFFLGTRHETHGTDASHRGGPAGFVRVEGAPDGRSLWWPDYRGNNMFNSLGNLAVDPTAALLFTDLTTGTTLHLSGTARVEDLPDGSAGDDGRTGRRVRFTPDAIVTVTHSGLVAGATTPYRRNPALT